MLMWMLMGSALAMPWAPPNDQVKDFNKAVKVANAGKHEKAEAQVRAVLEHGDCGMCLSLLGRSLLLQNRAEEALEVFLPLLVEFPDQTPMLSLATSAAFASERFEDARNIALATIAADPGSSVGHKDLLLANLRLGLYEDAARSLERAEAQLDDQGMLACMRADLALEQDQLDEVEHDLSTCRSQGKESYSASLWQRYLHLSGDTAAAQLAAEEMGVDYSAKLLAAHLAWKEGELEDAIRLYGKAIDERPDDPFARVGRGRLYYQLGELEKALEDFSHAFEVDLDAVDMERTGHVTGTTTKRVELQLKDAVGRAAAGWVSTLVALERLDEARSIAAKARQQLDDPAVLAVIDSQLAMAEDAGDAAWAALEPHADSDGDLVKQQLDKLAATYPDGIPAWAQPLLGDEMSRYVSEKLAADSFNAAVDAYNHQDWEICLEKLPPDLQIPSMGDGTQIDALRFQCLVGGEHYEQAEAYVEQVGMTQVDPGGLFNLGVAIYNGGEPERGEGMMAEACARLEGKKPKTCKELVQP